MKRYTYIFIFISFFFSGVSAVYAQSPFGTTPTATQIQSQSNQVESNQYAGTGISAGNANNAGSATSAGNATSAGGATSAGTGISAGSATSSGIGLSAGSSNAAGNGADQNSATGSFLQYALSLLFGQQSASQQVGTTGQQQVTDQNTFTEQYTTPVANQVESPTNTPSANPLSCSIEKKTLTGYLKFATCLMVVAIPLILAGTVLWFMVGALRYINDSEHEARQQYKTFLIWGIIIIFVAISFVYILKILTTTTGL